MKLIIEGELEFADLAVRSFHRRREYLENMKVKDFCITTYDNGMMCVFYRNKESLRCILKRETSN